MEKQPGLRVARVTHVALELSSPTRMERYLRDIFGLQLLMHGYWRGEYVRLIGPPRREGERPTVLLSLYNRPFIPRGRLRYVAFGVEGDVDAAVTGLRHRGYEVDGEDTLIAPGGLRIRIDSLTEPRPWDVGEPATKMADVPAEPNSDCLVQAVHHVALDVAEPARLLDWQGEIFGMDFRRHHDRRGEMISQIYYSDTEPDGIGRKMSLLPLFLRQGVERTELNHIAFDMPDAEGALGEIERRGASVDLPQDAIIHGPEEVWYQIDSRETPFPVDHVANQTSVTFIPYHNR